MKIDGLPNTFQFAPDPQPKPNEPAITRPDVVPAIQALNRPEFIGLGRELQYDADRERPSVRIVDRKTKRVLLQIDPETLLRIVEELERTGSLPELL